MSHALAAKLSVATARGEALYGIQLDFRKCFDSVPRSLTLELARAMGLDLGILRAIQGFYRQVVTRFKLAGCIGEAFRTTSGIF